MENQRFSRNEVQAGILLVLCVILLAGIVVVCGRKSPFWSLRRELFVAFEDVNGLRLGAPVHFNGVEVGQVRSLRILHITQEVVDRLPFPLSKGDLNELPLHPESLRRKLRESTDEEFEFDALCRKELLGRTMIEICLEVQGGETPHYRIDDKVRIVATVFGDSAVEIVSGNGMINSPERSTNLLLGTSGDFFSNLARSMGDVRNVLSNVTDVGDPQDKATFERTKARFGSISTTIDKMAEYANQRAAKTSESIDKITDDATRTMKELSSSLDSLQPKASASFDKMQENMKLLQARIDGDRKDAAAEYDELAGVAEKLKLDVKSVMDRSRNDYDQMQKSARIVYDDLDSISAKADALTSTAGRIPAQSQWDIARATEALKNGLVYLRQTGEAAQENKDLMLSNRDNGEYEFNTAVCAYRSMLHCVRQISEAGGELGEHTAALPLTGETYAVASRAQLVSGQIFKLRQSIDAVRAQIEDKMIPEYERKKAAWRR